MHCMLMDLLHGFEVLSTTEETLFNSRNTSIFLLTFVRFTFFDFTFELTAKKFSKSFPIFFCKIFCQAVSSARFPFHEAFKQSLRVTLRPLLTSDVDRPQTFRSQQIQNQFLKDSASKKFQNYCLKTSH